MVASLATYIAFPGNAGEAFEFWHSVLGGDLDVTRYGDAQLAELPFEPDAQAVAHAQLVLPDGAGTLTGCDVMDDEEYPLGGSAYSLLLTVDSPDEAHRIIDAFVGAGGRVGMPFARAPWGDYYGQVFDQFGIMWALSVPGKQA